MQNLERAELPSDYFYYRTISQDYISYLHNCSKQVRVIPLGDNGQFAWAKKILGFWVIKSEKIDTEIHLEDIRQAGISGHGIVLWVPWRMHHKKPQGWRSFWLPPTHNTTSGFTQIEPDGDYRAVWKTRVKRALARCRKHQIAGDVDIRLVSDDEFIDAYRETPIKYWGKEVFIEYFRAMRSKNMEHTQAWVAYACGKPVAGLAVYDYGVNPSSPNSSVHLVAFTKEEGKPLQVGTGLMDAWFSHAQSRGICYLNFDHLRDNPLAKDQQGYTDFKENFITYRYRQLQTWIKFF